MLAKNGQSIRKDFPQDLRWPMDTQKDAQHHLRNANKSHNEISPHTCQNGHYRKGNRNKSWQGCRERRILVHCWLECILVQLLWKTLWRFLKKKKKIENGTTTTWSSHSTSGYTSKRNYYLKGITAPSCSLA